MAYETIDFKADGPVARITLNRPDRLNSFTVQMHEELRSALSSLGSARVVVLTGAGRGFCAGQDLNDRAVAPGQAVDLGETVEQCWNPLIRTLTSLPQPVIARVNGVAAGAGANIALADSAFAYVCNGANHASMAAQASIVFLDKVREGETLIAEATEVAREGRAGVTRVAVRTDDGRTVAEFTGYSRTLGGAVVSSAD